MADDMLAAQAARYEQTIAGLRDAHARFRDEVLPRVAAVTNTVHHLPFYVPFRGQITATADAARDDLNAFEKLFTEMMVPVLLPRRLWHSAQIWTEVREQMSAVAGDLAITNREIQVRWRGAAETAYESIIPAHIAAATQLATNADAIQLALSWGGSSAATFYTALLAILLAGTAAILTALATAVAVAGALGPLGGLGGIVLLAMVAAGLFSQLASLVNTGADAYGRMRIWMNELRSEMHDNSALPNGTWPAARQEWFKDGSVADHDADWSLEH